MRAAADIKVEYNFCALFWVGQHDLLNQGTMAEVTFGDF